MPAHEVPLALLIYNVGVEAGQLLFVCAVLSVLGLARRAKLPTPAWVWPPVTYAISSTAAFWTIGRVVASIGLTA